jgi:phosphoribosylanthranilate isomerase
VVKICGLTRAEDVIVARDLGAWGLGFVFALSPRRLTPDAARGLIERVAKTAPPAPELIRVSADDQGAFPAASLAVGVFGDIPAAEVARIVEQVGLDAVQLHGRSGPSAGSVRQALAGWERPLRLAGGRRTAPPQGILIIQAVPVDSHEPDQPTLRERIERACADADLILLDSREAGRFGGTGTPFPWGLAAEAAAGSPVLVAGGIGPDNARAALERSAAWGVDVSSGVEASPGLKDVRLMEKLFIRVAESRAAGRRAGGRVGGCTEGRDTARAHDSSDAQGDDEDQLLKGPRT